MTTRLSLTLGTYRGSSWFHCPSATGSVAGRELEVDVQFFYQNYPLYEHFYIHLDDHYHGKMAAKALSCFCHPLLIIYFLKPSLDEYHSEVKHNQLYVSIGIFIGVVLAIISFLTS